MLSFYFSLLLSSYLIKYNLKPLIKLKEGMKNYSLEKNSTLKEDKFKNEISVINNSAVKMVKKSKKSLKKEFYMKKRLCKKIVLPLWVK